MNAAANPVEAAPRRARSEPVRAAARPRLLIVEDDPGLCSQYKWAFAGFEVLLASDRTRAMAILARDAPSVVLVDLGLPPDPDGVSEGFATIGEILARSPRTKVIVATSHGDRTHALRAIGMGAYDFFEKSGEIEMLAAVVARAQHLSGLESENRRLSAAPSANRVTGIVTHDAAMLKVCRDIERLAATGVTVLLAGESGTGKEALARALHDLGPRARGPFVAINCGAIPENLLESELFGHERGAFTGAVARAVGRIEHAHRGTLFLDEIGDLPLPLQVKLLRFLQEQVIERVGGRATIPVDVRVVSATNLSLERQVEEGRFRADLYYRINPVTVRIPPLRDRPGDPVLLARMFIERFNAEFNRGIGGLDAEAVQAIESHRWSGNVRELENRIKRAVIMSDGRLIVPSDLELEGGGEDGDALDLRTARLRSEREVLVRALARADGNLAQAARLLGISRPTLYQLLETHGLARPDAADPQAGR